MHFNRTKFELYQIFVNNKTRGKASEAIMRTHDGLAISSVHQTKITKEMKINKIKESPECIWLVLKKGTNEKLNKALKRIPNVETIVTEIDSITLSSIQSSWIEPHLGTNSNELKNTVTKFAISRGMTLLTWNLIELVIVHLMGL